MTACVLGHRDGRWLLGVRGPDVAYAPGALGLVGGHVEPADLGVGALEAAACRELAEETGVRLDPADLTYLESTAFPAGSGDRQVSVTFLAPVPAGVEPVVRAADELTAVGWWSAEEAVADHRCPVWLPPVLHRAGARLR